VQLLLKHGAQVDFEGQEGETPLLLASAAGHHEVVRLLLTERAAVNHGDEVNVLAQVLVAVFTQICLFLAWYSNPLGRSAVVMCLNNILEVSSLNSRWGLVVLTVVLLWFSTFPPGKLYFHHCDLSFAIFLPYFSANKFNCSCIIIK
jgi:hypothetical protein